MAKIKKRAGIRYHLIPLLGATALCICLIAAYAYNIQSDIGVEAAATVRTGVAGSTGAISRVIESNLDALRRIAAAADCSDPAALQSEAARLEELALWSGYTCLGLADASGVLRLGCGGTIDISADRPFQLALSGQPALSDPVADRVSGKRIVTFSVPVPSGDAPIGCLSASKDYDVFASELMQSFEGMTDGYACIIGEDGEIIFRVGSALCRPVDNNYYSSMQNLADGIGGAMDQMRADLAGGLGGTVLLRGKSKKGGERFFGYAGYQPVPGRTDWSIVCFAPMHAATAYTRKIILKSAALTAALVALALLSTVAVMRADQRRQRELGRLQDTDPLTGASTFSKFCRDAERLLRENRDIRYALSYSDIRGFKLLNDALGYEVGDHVLQHFASLLREDLRSGGTFARVAGDNFISIRSYKDRAELTDRFRRIEAKMRDFEETRRQGYLVRICTGFLCVEDLHGELPVSGMLDRANYAQKTAKNGGPESCAFYTEEIRRQVLLEQELENRMGAALENGEFEVFYQPKYDPRGDALSGAEALVRWRDPERGFLPPSVFIPLFERNHFIARLDRYVFERVCRDMSRWREEGLDPVRVSVNVSRMQLRHSEFVPLYASIRDANGVPEGMLEVELTESIAYEDMDAFSRSVGALHGAGFTCSLDDFGSGYSSLGLLGNLSVDVLKLDRQFFYMEDPADRRRGDIVVESVIGMAHRLDMAVVAEGVETPEQLSTLRRMGCDLVQGYIYARPLPCPEFEKLLRSQIRQRSAQNSQKNSMAKQN